MFWRLLAGVAVVLSSTPAMADIIVDQAMITAGELRVVGRLTRARQTSVTLDGTHQTRSEANGRFTFRLVYHPANCIVTLQADEERREAVVGFCGQRGPEGQRTEASAAAEQPAAGQPGAAGAIGMRTPPTPKRRSMRLAAQVSRRPSMR